MTPAPGLSPLRRMRQALAGVKRLIRDHLRGETSDSFFDIHDLRELNPLLERCAVPPLILDSACAIRDTNDAARFVVALLLHRPPLRRRFPTALSDGPTGAFAKWLASDALAQLHISPEADAAIRAAFRADLSQRVRRVYELREDLRQAFPFGITPKQRGAFAAWLLTFGKFDFELTAEEVLWWLFEMDEDPSCGLGLTYLLTPSWQEAVPHGLTVFGWPSLKEWLAKAHRLTSRWARRAQRPRVHRPTDELRLLRQARPDLPPVSLRNADTCIADLKKISLLSSTDPVWRMQLSEDDKTGLMTQPGVNFIAHYRYASGLQEAAFAAVKGLECSGFRILQRDIPVNFACDWRERRRFNDLEIYDVSIVCAAVNTFFQKFIPFSGLRLRDGVHRIALWYWELEQVPTEWIHQAHYVDEIWAPTRFIADAMRNAMSKPVHSMLPGVEIPADFPRLPKSHFGLRDDQFLFLFMFDMGSVMTRKNPLGLITAFRRAFTSRDPVQLAIKVSRGRSNKRDLARLLDAANAAGVTIIDQVLLREETLALVAAADAYVSLHRSEGLGLSMIESMLLGTPTIATGYSGNLDFMTHENSFLVDFKRVPIDEEIPPYPRGCIWAEPDLDHAASLMRRIYDRPMEARIIAQRGQSDLRELLSIPKAGARMADRLREIR